MRDNSPWMGGWALPFPKGEGSGSREPSRLKRRLGLRLRSLAHAGPWSLAGLLGSDRGRAHTLTKKQRTGHGTGRFAFEGRFAEPPAGVKAPRTVPAPRSSAPPREAEGLKLKLPCMDWAAPRRTELDGSGGR